MAQLRLIKPNTAEERSRVRSLQSRTILMLKLLTRLHEHPPPERDDTFWGTPQLDALVRRSCWTI